MAWDEGGLVAFALGRLEGVMNDSILYVIFVDGHDLVVRIYIYIYP